MAAKTNKKSKNKKNNKNLKYFAAAGVIALIAVLIFAFNLGKETNLGDKAVMAELNYETASKTSFHINGKNIFYCSKDGMRMLDEKGNTLWTDTYTMQQPVLLGDGDYAAVAEERGRVVRVYDVNGLIYEIQAENPITTFTVNKKGYTAVVMEMPNEYLTNIYNSLGSVVSISSCPASESIPIAIDISDDSSVYATSYIETNAVSFKSNVVMRYVGKDMAATAETIDGMFTAFSGGNSIVGKLDFSGESALCAISDKEIVMADIAAGTCTEKLRSEINGIMTAVDVGDNGSAAIALRAENGGHIRCFSKAGKEAASFDTDAEVTYLKVYNDLILAVMGTKLAAFDYSGSEVWTVISGQDVKQAFIFASNNEIVIAGSNKMRTIKVKKGETINEGVAADNEEKPEIVTEERAETVSETVETVSEVTTETVTEAAVVADLDDDEGSDDEEYYEDEEYDENYGEDYEDEEYYDEEDEDYSDDEDYYYDEEDDYSEDYDDENYDEEDYNEDEN